MLPATVSILVAGYTVSARAEPNHSLSGRLRVVTYNVAGLPESLSNSHPYANLPRIGQRLNKFDLALVQEDFAYPARLRKNLTLPHATRGFERGNAFHFGDGLSTFGRFALGEPQRESWQACSGYVDSYFDCLTPKGLAMTEVTLAPGVVVDVYNVHLDAGRSDEDRAARSAQLGQLARAIATRSKGHAVILGGDFNLSGSEQRRLLEFEKETGLRDACRALECGEPWRIDRVLLRSSQAVELTPRSWRAERDFRDEAGQQLSDHLPVSVELTWRVL